MENTIIIEALSGLIREGLIDYNGRSSWSEVCKWIDRHYPKPFTPEEYYNYIHSEEWSMEKEKQFSIHGRECEICGSTQNLQVHHISYDRGRYPADDDFAVLCHDCHEKLHRVVDAVYSDFNNDKIYRVYADSISAARRINEVWPYGIIGERKVRAVSVIRNTIRSLHKTPVNLNHITIAKNLIKRRKR